MTREDAIKRLEVIISNSAAPENLEAQARDWENYGKNRTYLSIVETATYSKHYVKRDYGFIDNLTGEYHPGKVDINDNYTFSGARF